jgi:tRNA(Ile)-lysidine synthase TilS/MesJ
MSKQSNENAENNAGYMPCHLGIIKQASELAVCESICSFCSRMKRGRLYACARRHGYNVLAIGQHLDDIAERFLAVCYFTRSPNYIFNNIAF